MHRGLTPTLRNSLVNHRLSLWSVSTSPLVTYTDHNFTPLAAAADVNVSAAACW